MCKDLNHVGPGGLKALSMLGDVTTASNEGELWMPDQQQESFNQLPKNYIQTMQDLNHSRFNHGYETTLEPEQVSPKYKELKDGFWKRLAANKDCSFHNEEMRDSSRAQPPTLSMKEPCSDNTRSISSTHCKKVAKSGPLDRRLNGLVEFKVVLTGKRNGNTLEEAMAVRKRDQDIAGHMHDIMCNSCENDTKHSEEVDVLIQDGIDQSLSANGEHDDNICQTRTSLKEVGDEENLKEEMVPTLEDLLHHHQQQEQQQKDGSECNFGGSGGIGRGRIGEDGSPTNALSNQQV